MLSDQTDTRWDEEVPTSPTNLAATASADVFPGVVLVTFMAVFFTFRVMIRLLNGPVRKLDRWAESNHYQVIDRTERFGSNAGPFAMQRIKGDTVFRVSVQGADGANKLGWIRVGSIASLMDVRWDAEIDRWPEVLAAQKRMLSDKPVARGFEVIPVKKKEQEGLHHE